MAYNTLYSGLREASCGISFEEFRAGYFIHAFDLTPDRCNQEHYNLLKDGKLGVKIEIKKLPQTTTEYTLISYLEFDTILRINKDRKINKEFSLD